MLCAYTFPRIDISEKGLQILVVSFRIYGCHSSGTCISSKELYNGNPFIVHLIYSLESRGYCNDFIIYSVDLAKRCTPAS